MPPLKQRRILNYTEEQMLSAVEDVQRGMPVATSAKKHGVPRITLLYKIKGKTPMSRQMGRDSYLTKNEENLLGTWVVAMARAGFPIGKTQLLDSVQHIMIELKRNNPFKNNRPGKSWYCSFLKRNKNISVRTPQNLTASRASVTKNQLTKWFSEVFDYLKTEKYDQILEYPTRVFNADEAAFFLNPKGDKVLAHRGDKNIYQKVNADEKECLTVLMTGNAAGIVAPPMIIFKYERIPRDLALSVPSSWGIGKSESGWMTGETFFEYVTNVFHPWLIEQNIELPIILFIDGHVSHLTLHTSKFCEQNGIILVALYPNATHKIQPMDVAVFRTFKAGWEEGVHQWRLENINQSTLKKIHFSPLLEKVIEKRITPDILINGFRKCGLVPWNPDAVEFGSVDDDKKKYRSTEKMKRLKELQDGILFLDRNIDPRKLSQFKETNEWMGDLQDISLFKFYKKCYNEIITLKENLGSENSNIENVGEDRIQEEESNNFEKSIVRSQSEDSDRVNRNNRIKDDIETNENSEHRQVDVQEITSANPENIVENLDQQTPIKKPENFVQKNNHDSAEIIPSPFKKFLFYPDPKNYKKKKTTKEKVPSVVTSKQWQIYHEKKEQKKKLEVENKRIRAEERKQKKEMLAKAKEQKQLEKKKKKIQKKRKEISSDSESEEEEWEESGSSIDDISFMNVQENMMLHEVSDTDNNYKENDYVLVNFPGKKRTHTYVCVIQEILTDNEAEVVALKQCADSKQFQLNENDVSTIKMSQILKKLQFPKILASGDRLKYEFFEEVNVDG